MTECWPEEPTQRADDVAYAMRDYYEANRPLRWWEKRNPPGTWGCIADNLMIGLRNIVLNAEYEYRASVDGRRMAETENTGSVPQGTTSAVPEGQTPEGNRR